jgi:hypothetical protein
MTTPMERHWQLVGRMLDKLSDIIPHCSAPQGRDYDAAVSRAAEALEDDASEPLEPREGIGHLGDNVRCVEHGGIFAACKGLPHTYPHPRPGDDYAPPRGHPPGGPAPRVVDKLGPDERGTEWQSDYGTRWRWNGDRWERQLRGDTNWHPAGVGYTPQASRPFTEIIAQSAMDWHGWAVPAILEVLAFNIPGYVDYAEWTDWAETVAPKIADRIGCDPARAAEALSRYKPR